MDVIYYNRISTDNKDQDPTSNLNKCESFCKFENHNIKFKLIDMGVSGSVAYYDRLQGKEIDQIAEKYFKMGKPLGIVVFSIDRFSREHPVYSMVHIENLKKKGVVILSATESIFNEESEFALPMQFNILWFNFYFLTQHSKKVKAGNEKRRQQGLHVGRALIKKVIGKGKNKTYIYYSDDELKEIHKVMREEKKQGFSYREIKARLEQHNIKLSISYISKVLSRGRKR